MQFTPQQMAGYRGYSSGTLVGNWYEDVQVREDRMKEFQRKRVADGGKPKVGGGPQLTLTPQHEDGFLRFGDVVYVKHSDTNNVITIDSAPNLRPKMNHALASCVPHGLTPSLKNALVVRRAKDANHAKFTFTAGGQQSDEANIVRYGQAVRLVNEYLAPQDGHFSLCSDIAEKTSVSRRQRVTASLAGGPDCAFIVSSACEQSTMALEGTPVPVNANVMLLHRSGNVPLASDKETRCGSNGMEISCFTFKDIMRKKTPLTKDTRNFWRFECAPPGATFKPFTAAFEQTALERVRNKILQRGGTQGFRGLVKSLKIMDDDGSRTLTRKEFKEGMEVYGVFLGTAELDTVFTNFDKNGDGTICITEFLRALRGRMNDRRLDLVKEAFNRIDLDRSGVVTVAEIRQIYGANLAQHPEVLAKTKTETEVMREFMQCWDKSADGKIILEEFVEYYSDLSVSIDSDDYFELMIRNAWHMSGGEGVCENTSNRRVLVVHSNGRSEVVEIENDLGIDEKDTAAMIAALEAQGVEDIARIELAM